MAFLQHPRRKAAAANGNDAEYSPSASRVHPSSSLHSSSIHRRIDAARPSEPAEGANGNGDWSVVFPGRVRASQSSAQEAKPNTIDRQSQNSASQPPSPFYDPEQDPFELALPPLHDGTGRFTRPSSPSFGDDEDEEQLASPVSPSAEYLAATASPSDIFTTSASLSDEEIDFDDLASSAVFSETEFESALVEVAPSQRRESTNLLSARLPRRTSHRSTAASSESRSGNRQSSSSSSWAWMNEVRQTPKAVTGRRPSTLQYHTETSWDVMPSAILTSESEGEEDTTKKEKSLLHSRRLKEEEAFEEDLNAAYLAQSAGLRSRLPKRRHRRNGESEKGSKRSNNTSAARASEILSAQQRLRVSSRRSQASAVSGQRSARSGNGVRKPHKSNADTHESHRHHATETESRSKSERLLSAILQRIFGVEDDEVLAAFLRDEGPLKADDSIDEERAIAAANATRPSLGARSADADDIWSRNARQRRMRLLLDGRSVPEEVKEESDDDGDQSHDDDEQAQKDREAHEELLKRVLGRDHLSQRYPARAYVPENVSEPSLTEALQASVVAGLRGVPSGLSVLLAGTNSVRLVNYLVNRIGPTMTERVRKLLESEVEIEETNDETDLSSTVETIVRSARSNSVATSASSLRFKGSAHPAIASSPSSQARLARSNSQATTATIPASSF